MSVIFYLFSHSLSLPYLEYRKGWAGDLVISSQEHVTCTEEDPLLLASLETHTDRQLAAKEDDSIEKLIPSDFGLVVKQWIGGAAPSRKYSNIEKV